MKPWTRSITALVLLGLTALLACSDDTDEEKIRALIDEGARMAEAHDISGILELGTKEVVALPMGIGRREIRGLLWRTFTHYGPLHLLYPSPTVEIDDDTGAAEVRFPFLIVRKEQTIPDLETLRDDPGTWLEQIGDNADLYRLRLEWVRQDGDWRVDRVTVER